MPLALGLVALLTGVATAYDPWEATPQTSTAKAVARLVDSTAILSPISDSAPDSDGLTAFPIVQLEGVSLAGASVAIEGTDRATSADAAGRWILPDVILSQGTNSIPIVFSEAEETRALTLTVRLLSPAEDGDAVLDWNAEALDVIRRERLFPPPATRLLAMIGLATHQAISAVGSPDRPAAAATAAHRILTRLFPFQKDELDARLELSLADSPASPSRDAAIAIAVSAADQWIAARSNDGAALPDVYTPGTPPGRWRPTLPALRPALLPRWAEVRPFALDRPGQFQLPGPPALGEEYWAEAANEVWSVGEFFSSSRTAEETTIAEFWADQTGTATPSGHWNRIAATVALERGDDISANARLFALLNVAQADAAIACWEQKYHHDFWRPITAIYLADLDGNDGTALNTNWSACITTPPFPEYPSGHSTFSGAAETILGHWFGHDVPFVDQSDAFPLQFNKPDITRSYTGFQAAAHEASRSRVLGGIHYEFSCIDGLILGRTVGEWVLGKGLPGDAPAETWMLW